MSDSLGIDDDVMGLAMLTVGNDIIDNILFVVIVLLGKQDILGAVGNTAPQSNVSGICAVLSVCGNRSEYIVVVRRYMVMFSSTQIQQKTAWLNLHL